MNSKTISIIGPGRVGQAFHKVFSKLEYPIVSVVGRGEKITELGDIVFITTPDAEIETVAHSISKSRVDESGKFILHCSGTIDLNPLKGLEIKGAKIGCFHPLQAITEQTNSFRGITFDVMGNAEVVEQLTQLTTEMGAKVMEVSAHQKEMLHVAAVVASNYQVTLAHLASDIAGTSGLESSEVRQALVPLMQSVIENLRHLSPNKALTGPVARGDVSTLKKHVELLKNQPEQLKLYKLLGQSTLDMLGDEQISTYKKEELRTLFDV